MQDRKSVVKWIMFVLVVACAALMMLVAFILGTNNRLKADYATLLQRSNSLSEQVLSLEEEKKALQQNVDNLRQQNIDISNLSEQRRQEVQKYVLDYNVLQDKADRMRIPLSVYYEFCGIVGSDEKYYHRMWMNESEIGCPIFAAEGDEIRIYNINAMPHGCKPCPYCYSEKADLPVEGVTLHY